jgi:hypothetical protein
METLHVLVMGPFGIVHNQEFKDAVQKDIYDFSITLTEDMRPEARGIAFYVRPSDGVIVFDEFVISSGVSVENSVSIFLLLLIIWFLSGVFKKVFNHWSCL